MAPTQPRREEEDAALEVFTVDSGQNGGPTPPKVKKSPLQIDREMLRVKLHFFAAVGTTAIALPFMPVIVTTLIGLTGSSLGIILTFQQLIYIFLNPLIGYVTDFFNKLKAMICIMLYAFVLFITLLLFIPSIGNGSGHLKSDAQCQMLKVFSNGTHKTFDVYRRDIPEGPKYNDSVTLNRYVGNATDNERVIEMFPCMNNTQFHIEGFTLISENMTCYQKEELIWRDNSNVDYPNEFHIPVHVMDELNETLNHESFCCKEGDEYYVMSCDPSHGSGYSPKRIQLSYYQFWVTGLCVVISLVALSALWTLSDTACCELVQKHKSDFGKQRLFCSLGFGIMIMISGALYDASGSYTADFVLMWILSVITAFNLYKMDLVKPKLQKNILHNVGIVLASREFLVFLFGVLINGMGMSLSRYYHILFLTRIGASRFLCGLVVGFQKLVEVPFMFFSGVLIRKAGHLNVLSACLAAYCLRYLCLAYILNPWLALPVEIIQGVSGGLFFPAATSFAKSRCRPGTEATTQAVVFATFDGLGMGLGSVLFGLGLDAWGGHRAFFYGATFFAAGTVALLLLTLFLALTEKGTHKKGDQEPNNGPS